MGINDGCSDIYVFNFEYRTFKVVLNYTRKMYTVYARNNRILIRMQNVPPWKMKEIREELQKYIGKSKRPPKGLGDGFILW